ncbi:MAG: ABC transporter transmembrane domain-containing protein, partial [Anaerolineae bacterium]|nr:ABC transporter transmembrane domain-containing protein [Anaerolineae bacterium]
MNSSNKQEQGHGPKATDTQILVRCFGYTKPHWRLAVVGYSLLVVINVIVITIPQLMRGIVDRGIEQRDLDYLTWSVLGLLGLTVVQGVLSYFQGNAIERTSQNVAYDLRNELYQKLSSLSFSY